MLNFSIQFLEILQSGTTGSSDSADFAALKTDSKEISTRDSQQPLMAETNESSLEDGATTTSSNDSGYSTMTTSPSDHTKALTPFDYELSTTLSMLVTYCHLVRVYRSVFIQLYRLFLIIPTADVTPFLLLPTLQFGQYHMDGNIAMQVQVLIELSSNLLSKIERALGMSYGSAWTPDGNMTQTEAVFGDNPLALIRKQIMSQEHMECGVSLKETIDCLRQLVKDPASA